MGFIQLRDTEYHQYLIPCCTFDLSYTKKKPLMKCE
jgi:hypothetical protein